VSRYLQHNEMVYELRDTPLQHRQRTAKLAVVYALVDPRGWDSRKLDMAPGELRNMWRVLKEVHAAQQETDHPGAGLAGHVPDGAAAHDEERVAAGLP
jgi:hypothetical protein